MQDIIKIVRSFEDSCILRKDVTRTIENETKKQKDGFLSMLLMELVEPKNQQSVDTFALDLLILCTNLKFRKIYKRILTARL